MDVFDEVRAERERQDVKWGEQNHPDGTQKHAWDITQSIRFKKRIDWSKDWDEVRDMTWRIILQEEVYEAFAEKDPAALRAELLQVAAVAIAWCEAIDRRSK